MVTPLFSFRGLAPHYSLGDDFAASTGSTIQPNNSSILSTPGQNAQIQNIDTDVTSTNCAVEQEGQHNVHATSTTLICGKAYLETPEICFPLETHPDELQIVDDFVKDEEWRITTTVDRHGATTMHIRYTAEQLIDLRVPRFHTESHRSINFDMDQDWTFEDAREYNRELSTTLRNPKSTLRRKLIAQEKKAIKKRKMDNAEKERDIARKKLRDLHIESQKQENHVHVPRAHNNSNNSSEEERVRKAEKTRSRISRKTRLNKMSKIDEQLHAQSINAHMEVDRSDIESVIPRYIPTRLTETTFYTFREYMDKHMDLGPYEQMFTSAHTICVLLYQLQRSRNFGDYYTAISSFLNGFCSVKFLQNVGISSLTGFIASKFMNDGSSDSVRDDVHLQYNPIQTLKDIDTYMDQIVSSTFSTNVSTILVSAAALKFFSKDVAVQIYNIFGKAEKGSTMGSMLRKSFSAIVKMMEKGQMYINGECTLAEIFFEGDILQKKLYDARAVLAYRNRLFDGLPVEGKKNTTEYAKEVSELLRFFKGEVSRRKPKDPKYNELFNTYMELNDSLNDIQSKAGAQGRTPPFAIILHGTGGVGKSHLIKFIVSVLCEVMGWTYSDSLMYCRNAFQDYFTGYEPLSQPVIHYPELGTIHKNIVSRQGDPTLSELTAVIDSLPFACNMAEVENKGKVYILAKLVIMDTNTQDLNLDVVVNNPTAFQRRFLYIEPIVKPQYREQNSNQIDGQKCTEGPMMDRWYFNVVKKRVINNRDSVDVNILDASKYDDIYDLKRILKEHFVAHFKGETELIKKIEHDILHTNYDVRPGGVKGAPGLLEEKQNASLEDFTYDLPDPAYAQKRKRFKVVVKQAVKVTKPSNVEGSLPYNTVIKQVLDDSDEKKFAISAEEFDNISLTSQEDINESSAQIDSVHLETRTSEILGVDQVPDLSADFDVAGRPTKYINRELGFFDYVTMWYFKSKRPVPKPILWTRGLFDLIAVLFATILSGSVFGLWSIYFIAVKYVLSTLIQYWFGTFVTWGIVWGVTTAYFNIGMWPNLIASTVIHHFTTNFRLNDTVVVDMARKKRNRFDYHCDRLAYKLGVSTHNPEGALPDEYDRHIFSKSLAVGIMVAGLGKMMYSLYQRKPHRAHGEAHTDFQLDSERNEALNFKEDKYHCGGNMKIVKGSELMKGWNVMSSEHVSTLQTEADLRGGLHKICKNVRKCKVITESDGKQYSSTTYLLGIVGEFAVINTHALSGSETGELHVCETGINSLSVEKYRITKFGVESIRILSNDITLVRVSAEIFGNITAFCAADMIYPPTSDGYLAKHPLKVYYKNSVFRCADEKVGVVQSESYFEYTFSEHTRGLCGLPLIIQKDSGYSLVGIHSAGANESEQAYAFPIDFKSVFNAIEMLRNSSPLMPLHSSTESLLDLEEPSHKSPFRYEELHGLRYLGKTKHKVMIHNKSKLKRTFLSNNGSLNEMFFDILSWQPTQRYGPPMMAPQGSGKNFISPYNIGLRKMSTQNKALDYGIVEKIVREYTEHIVAGLRAKGVTHWTPLTFQEVINGIDGNDYIRRVNASTSAGYGYSGKKGKFLPIVFESPGVLTREMNAQLKEDVDDLLNEYESGTCGNILFDIQLKDEARKWEKCIAGKTRLFYMAPLHYLIVKKMFMTPFNAAMVEHCEIFGARIGINMHMEADKIYRSCMEYLRYFGELDVEDYDIKMPFMLGWAAASVEYRVSEAMGYNEAALKTMRGVQTDSLHVKMHMKGDVFVKPGHKPSGDDGTAHNNCVRTRLMLMYLWYRIKECRDKRFTDNVITDTYGDDMLMLIRKFFQKYYNNVSIARLSEEELGMKCTSALKDGSMKELVSCDEMSFLKRTFRPKRELDNLIVAPLDMNSIYRMLEWHLPSNNVNLETQMASTILSALTELYFHTDEKEYTEFRRRLIHEYCEKFNVDITHMSSMLPTFHHHTTKFMSGYRHTPSEEEKLLSDPAVATTESFRFMLEDRIYQLGDIQIEFTRPPLIGDNPPSEERGNRLANTNDLLTRKFELNDELSLLKRQLQELNYPYTGMHPRDIRKVPIYGNDVRFRMASDEYISLYSRIASLEQTIHYLNKQISYGNFKKAHAQSDISVSTIGREGQVQRNQTVSNNSGEPEFEVKIGETHEQENFSGRKFTPDMFVERPVQLGHFTLAPGVDLTYVNNVWENFFLNSDVRAKLRRYALFKADLVIKIEVAGQQFHSGKIQLAYLPCFDVNQVYTDYMSTPAYRYQLLQYLSQLEGTVNTDPRFNQPVIIRAPYISPQPVLRLYNNSSLAISDSTPFDDLHSRGVLHVSTINQIKVTNSTSAAPVSILISAWLENVEYGISTGTVLQVTTESLHEVLCAHTESKSDERIVGPVERFSMAASRVANALSNVSFLTPYAKASEMAFSAIGSFAAIFGFSTPTMNTPPSRVKNEPYQCTANVVGYRTGKRLTLDPQQELTISQSVVASNKDHMSIREIASRRSLLTTFTWAHGAEPLTTKLWDCLVNPKVGGAVNQTDQYFIQPTALAFISNIAQYWRGELEFTFEVACSNFHKGKIAIGFEPNIPQLELATTDMQLNERFYQIFDIQDVQEITYCVPWASAKEWLCTMFEEDVFKSMGGAEFNLTNALKTCNGYLFVTPYLALQSPDNSDISINVYVRCKDLELNFATDEFLPWTMNYVNEVVEEEMKAEAHTECLYDFLKNIGNFGSRKPQEGVDFVYVDREPENIMRFDPHLYEAKYNSYVGYLEGDDMVNDEDAPVWTDWSQGLDMLNVDGSVCDVTVPWVTHEAHVESNMSASTYPSSCEQLNPTGATKLHICENYFGERLTTLRSALKRPFVSERLSLSGPSGTSWALELNLPIIPTVLPTPSAETNRQGVSLFNYCRFAFLGMRGSLYKRIYLLGGSGDNMTRVNVSLKDPSLTTSIPSIGFVPASSINLPFNGSESYMPNTNAGIEFDIPFYSNNLFVWSCDTNPYTTDDKTLEPRTLRNYRVQMTQHGSQESFLAIEETAIGEDFSYLLFLAAPPYSINK